MNLLSSGKTLMFFSALISAWFLVQGFHPAPSYAIGPQEKLSARQVKKLPGWKPYKKLCADCHGDKGDGKGVLGKTMTPEPANYQSCDILSAVSDDDMKKIILEGSAAVGKSNAMQGFKKKIKDPAILDQIIEVVRSFGGCGYSGNPQ